MTGDRQQPYDQRQEDDAFYGMVTIGAFVLGLVLGGVIGATCALIFSGRV